MESDFYFYLHFQKSRGGGFVTQEIKKHGLIKLDKSTNFIRGLPLHSNHYKNLNLEGTSWHGYQLAEKIDG